MKLKNQSILEEPMLLQNKKLSAAAALLLPVLFFCGTYHFCAGLWSIASHYQVAAFRWSLLAFVFKLQRPLRRISVSSLKSTDEPRRVSSLFRRVTRCYYFTVRYGKKLPDFMICGKEFLPPFEKITAEPKVTMALMARYCPN